MRKSCDYSGFNHGSAAAPHIGLEIMGDRVEKSRLVRGPRPLWATERTPPEIRNWGLAAAIGHNNGPPIEDEPNDAFVRYRWKKAHAEAWKHPSFSILRFRVARAEAAGVTYRAYMLELLDTGRHLQAGDASTGRSIPAGSPGEAPVPVILETPQPKDEPHRR